MKKFKSEIVKGYNRKCETLKKLASQFGDAVALDLFKTYSNPENIGSNFSWNNFPDLVKRMAKASCYSNFSDREWERLGKILEQIACDSAYNKAKELV